MAGTVVASVGELLTAEQAGALTLVEQERRAARQLAAVMVAEHLGTDPGGVRIAQTCAGCGGPHGRPQVVGHDVHVGWSHSGGLVAVVVDDRPCAIDVESLALLAEPPAGSLTERERAWLARQPDRGHGFGELWVRKEVLVKLGLVTLDESLAVDVTPALGGDPVLGATLEAVDANGRDAVVARGFTAATT